MLARLGAEKRLVLEHNRGAFVPSPTVQDMRDVYRARRTIEAGLVASLFGRLTAEQVAAPRRHVQAEHRALDKSLAHLDHLERRVIAGAAAEQPVALSDLFASEPPRGKSAYGKSGR